jgi:hypothetical protein
VWSRRFWLVGLTSGVAVALLAYAAIWLVLYGFAALPRDATDIAFPMMLAWSAFSAVVGVPVYPICWFRKIQGARNYSIERTFSLVLVTYGASCLIVGAIICLIFIFFGSYFLFFWASKMFVVGVSKTDWLPAGVCVLIIVLSPVGAAFYVLAGVLITIVPYAVIAMPCALLHRWFLLAIFGPSNLSAPPANMSRAAASPSQG